MGKKKIFISFLMNIFEKKTMSFTTRGLNVSKGVFSYKLDNYDLEIHSVLHQVFYRLKIKKT